MTAHYELVREQAGHRESLYDGDYSSAHRELAAEKKRMERVGYAVEYGAISWWGLRRGGDVVTLRVVPAAP